MIKQQLSLDGASYSICLPDAETDYIQGKIFKSKQPYELEMLRDMAARLQPGDLVLDLGANIGNHALYLASVACCRVHAFPFNANDCEVLLASVEDNQLGSLVVGSVEQPELVQYEQLAAVLIGVIPSEDVWRVLIGELNRLGLPHIYVSKKCVHGFSAFSQSLIDKGYLIRNQDDWLAFFSEEYLRVAEGANSPFWAGYSAWQTSGNVGNTNEAGTELQQLKEKLSESNLRCTKALEKFNDLSQKHEVANLKYRDVTAQVTALKSEINKLETRKIQQQMEHDCSVEKSVLELEKVRFSLEKERSTSALSEERWGLYKERVEHELARVRHDFAEAQAKLVSLQAELEKCSELLNQTNEKYQEVTSQKIPLLSEQLATYASDVAELRHHIEQQEQQHAQVHARLEENVRSLEQSLQSALSEREELRQRLVALQQQLSSANQKYRQATGHEIPHLKQLLSDQEQRSQSLFERSEQLSRELKQARQEKADAQRALSVLRNSLTYKDGVHIRAARVSLKDAIKLPVRLWRLRQHLRPARDVASHAELLSPPTVDEHAALQVDSLAHKPNAQVRMACIMDDFTFCSYQPECQLFQLTPDNWQAELEATQPEVLFIESAWRGKDELWGSKVGHCSQELQGIVAWCRDRHIPTLFWNKEDPVHFETFLTTAQLFDFVFTTDMDCIHRYKAALGHEHVYFLPFACQPVINNPIEKYVRKDALCFAGAYYVRYPERTRDLESFVRELPDFRPIEIYDRNFGKQDTNYQFPEAYQPHIVGTLLYSEIDKAYKGYRFAINLNSIKQSQTMFARRVYELLGSNTLTISNYSRGVRLMFGDLVLTSDSGSEVRRRLELLEGEQQIDRLRLAGLRKVMSEHTYADRFNYLLEKITGQPRLKQLPVFTIVARAYNVREVEAVLANVTRQQGVEIELALICGEKLSPAEAEAFIAKSSLSARVLLYKSVRKHSLQDIAQGRWVAGMLADDYYGPHYLLDMALATRYSDAQIIGKAAFYDVGQGEGLQQRNPDQAYKVGVRLASRRSIIHPILAGRFKVKDWLRGLDNKEYDLDDQLAIDAFNYCQGACSQPSTEITAQVDDLPVNVGLSLADMTATAEIIEPLQSDLKHAPWLDGQQFGHLLQGKPFNWLKGHGLAASTGEDSSIKLTRNPAISTWLRGPLLEIDSQLPDGKHEYLYASKDLPLQELMQQLDERPAQGIPLHVQMDPGLNVSLVVLYLNKAKERLSHQVLQVNRNLTVSPPEGTELIRLGLRVYAGGSAKLHRLVLGHLDLEPANILGQSDVLLVTNHYPSYDDLYRNGFVHSRLKAYREHNVAVDVFRLRKDQPISWHEFQDIDVTTASQQALRRMLASGDYRHVLVHFLDPDMWDVLKDFIDTIKVTVWVHGADIQPWHRRKFNVETPRQEEIAKQASERRMAFWHSVLKPMPVNLHIVFVSRFFAEEVLEDLGFHLPEGQWSVIHNPIDTELFKYVEKDPLQRKKILSIRPYSSRVYANDLTVRCIQELSLEPFFNELEFRIIGDGVLFDETVAPLRNFNNVIIEKGFLSQHEVAALHKEYGVFLCPSRYDTQGVSRDEARASGLVAVVSNVAAVPEFVDETCAILAPPEDAIQLAKGIAALQSDVFGFKRRSMAGAARVQRQTSDKVVVRQELDIFSARRY